MYRIDKPAESAYKALVRQLPEVTSLFVVPYRSAPDYEKRIAGGARADEVLNGHAIAGPNRGLLFGMP